MEYFDILVIGAGAAGISAAKAAYNAGCKSVALVSYGYTPGGILIQCAHRGFGRDMTGTEYVTELLKDFPEEIILIHDTTVLSVNEDKTALLDNGRLLKFEQLILASGCREIAPGALNIAGTRPKGVYTAGAMQNMMNVYGYVPKGPVVILGSGDIGLIMAKTISELGIDVTMVEREEQCGGMARNRGFLSEGIVELLCGCTVAEIYGEPEIEKVRLSDGRMLQCGTLLIAAGLIPDRDLIYGLEDKDWLQLCGNCKSIHPMVEGVIAEGIKAGITAYERTEKRK